MLAPVTSIMGEILLVGMSAPEDRLMEARTAADWVLRPRLLAVPGVAQVVTIGGHVRQYQVLVDPEQLRAYGVGLDEVLERRRRIQPERLGRDLPIRRGGGPHPRDSGAPAARKRSVLRSWRSGTAFRC